MISKTGKTIPFRFSLPSSRGFSFIEAMVAVVVFSVAVVSIYQSYLISLDRTRYIIQRLYATVLLDDRLIRLERMLRTYQALPVDIERTVKIDMPGYPIEFRQQVQFREVEDCADIFEAQLTLSWDERGHDVKVSRTMILSDFQGVPEKEVH